MIKISSDRVLTLRRKLGMDRTEFGKIFDHSAGHQGHIETGERNLRGPAVLIFVLLEREGIAAVEALKADAAPIKPHFVAALPVTPEAHLELQRLAEVAWSAQLAATHAAAEAFIAQCNASSRLDTKHKMEVGT